MMRWYDFWLKGIDNGIMKEPPVRIFVMGSNEWVDENEWPMARTKWTNYYIHSGGHANTATGDGTLTTTAPSSETADLYKYDPANPAPFITAPSFAQIGGPDDYRPVEKREDVLVYSTAPLTADTEVCGPIRAELYAASSAPDTDFMVKLINVWPNGYAERLSDGMVRARYRDGMQSASPSSRAKSTSTKSTLGIHARCSRPGTAFVWRFPPAQRPNTMPTPTPAQRLEEPRPSVLPSRRYSTIASILRT